MLLHQFSDYSRFNCLHLPAVEQKQNVFVFLLRLWKVNICPNVTSKNVEQYMYFIKVLFVFQCFAMTEVWIFFSLTFELGQQLHYK